MFDRNKDKNNAYQPIKEDDEIELTQQAVSPKSQIFGYHLPNVKKPVIFNNESTHISYTDIKGDTVTLRSNHIPGFLRELRQQGKSGWGFHVLFQKMPQHQKFEDYLANSPSTALLDYRLLCLGDHILHLEKHPKTGSTNAADAVELAGLYAKLVARLQRYEKDLGALSQKPSSRHQNAERKLLVETFQADWQNLIAPVANKYKQTKDTYNILLNVATVIGTAGIGLIWLFIKNVVRLSQRKGLGLFQFEQAHSRKVENLQKFYEDVTKATQKDAKGLENYFADDLKITDESFNKLSDLIDKLGGLQQSMPIEGVYTKKEKKALDRMVEAFRSCLNTLQKDLQTYRRNPEEADETLPDIQKDFMEAWNKAAKHHEVSMHTSILTSKYPLACTQVITEIEQICQQFTKEVAEMEHATPTGRHSPSDDDSIDSSSKLV